MIEIEIDAGREGFVPGENVRGEVRWSFETPPEAFEVRLLWYTEGRGDRDVGVAHTLRVEGLSARGSRSFDLETPAGPYSWSGRLVSIRWAVEATALPGKETTRRPFVLTPDAREVTAA